MVLQRVYQIAAGYENCNDAEFILWDEHGSTNIIE